MTTTRARVFVEGRVTGVWFRESARAEAERLGLSGWVRNVDEGRVEAVFEGPEEAVAQAVAWAHKGPERAQVTDVREQAETPEGLTGFAIKPTWGDG